MSKLSKNQIQGVLLIISLGLLYLQIPFIDGKSIAAIIILILAIYNLVK